MKRPDIESYIELLKSTSPRPFRLIKHNKFTNSVGNETSISIAKNMCPQDAIFLVEAANKSESIIKYILYLEQQLKFNQFDFNNKDTWPELGKKVLALKQNEYKIVFLESVGEKDIEFVYWVDGEGLKIYALDFFDSWRNLEVIQ